MSDIRVLGTSNTLWTPGLRDCDEKILMPDISSMCYAERVLDVCRKHSVSVLLSCFDPDLAEIVRVRKQLQDLGVYCCFPDEYGVSAAFDKLKTFEVAVKYAINTPHTVGEYLLALQSIDNGIMNWPLIVKPRCGFASNGLRLVKNDAELLMAFKCSDSLIAQQYIEGDEINIDGLATESCEAISIIPWRKLLSRNGETEKAFTIRDDDAVNFGKEMISAFRIKGPFNADLIRDVSGNLWLIEINTRFGGGYPVCHFAGANFPARILSMASGELLGWNNTYRLHTSMLKAVLPIEGPPWNAI